jgi:Bacterial SH3 domain
MKHQVNYRLKRAMPTALLIIFAIVGCTGQVNAPTLPPVPSSTPEAALPTSVSVKSTATSLPVADKNVLYQDDFTNPGTGWDAAEFDNYFIGYHEPEWYHIEIRSANSRAVVSEPERRSVTDATLELQVYTNSAKTATEGDFRYGLVFRRSGDNYYAFTISPRTKAWEVFKSSANGLEVLQEGVDENIHDLDVDDLLRVDLQGSNFLFHINDELVGQATDPDYPSGEVGLFAQNLDSPTTHIHFNTFTIRDLTLSLLCTVNQGGAVNVRTGPSKTFPQISVLSSGDTVQALGKSPNEWIEIVMEGSTEPGWVSYSDGYMSCTPTVDLFPVITP